MSLNIPTENWFVCWPCREYFKTCKSFKKHNATLHGKSSESALDDIKTELNSSSKSATPHENTPEDIRLPLTIGGSLPSVKSEVNPCQLSDQFTESETVLDEKTGVFTHKWLKDSIPKTNTKCWITTESESDQTVSSDQPTNHFKDHATSNIKVYSCKSTPHKNFLSNPQLSPSSPLRTISLRPRVSRLNYTECFSPLSHDDTNEDMDSEFEETLYSEYKLSTEDAVKLTIKSPNSDKSKKSEEEYSDKNYFKCGVCNKGFHLRILLNRHILKHPIIDPSSSTYSQHGGKYRLGNSNWRCYNERRQGYECPKCTTVCSRLDNLKRHFRTIHTRQTQLPRVYSDKVVSRKETPHVRDCHRIGNAKAGKIIDLKINKGKPGKMPSNGIISFIKMEEAAINAIKSRKTRKGTVQKLQRLSESRFVSNLGDVRLSSRHNLSKRRRKCLAGRKFVCHECGFGFVHAYALSRHKSTHSKEQNYVCVVCGNKFTRNDTLKRHMRRTHSM